METSQCMSAYVSFVQLTSSEHFELFIVELHFPLRDQAAFPALPDWVHETHPGQGYLLTAAFITETPATAPAVVLKHENTQV